LLRDFVVKVVVLTKIIVNLALSNVNLVEKLKKYLIVVS
jgi:hypothetical protein